MRVVYHLCIILFVNSFMGTAQACLHNSLNTYLIDNTIKTKPTAKPKSQDLSSLSLITLSGKTIKLAAINFIAGGDQMKDQKIGTKPTPTKCPTGQVLYNGRCVTPCDASKYPYTAPFSATEEVSPACAEVASCNYKNKVYYGCITCQEGYNLTGYECKAPDCSSRPVERIDNSKGNGDCKICNFETKCKYISCNQGYDLNNGDCIIHECKSTEYPYDTSTTPDSNVGTPVYCYSGSTTSRWKYGSCKTGYVLSGGQCISTCNYTNTTKPANCATASDSCVKNGITYYSGSCSTCNNGWYLNGTICSENPCDGYTSTTSTITNCQATDTCQKGANPRYKCTKCNNGYQPNSVGLCEIIMCPTGSIIPSTYWCSDAWRCLMPAN